MDRKDAVQRFLVAERPLRPYGATVVSGEFLWGLVHKLWEHAVLSWITENLGEQIAKMPFVEFIILHPFWTICVSMLLYCMIGVLRLLRSNHPNGGALLNHSKNGDPPPAPRANAKTQGPNSPAVALAGVAGDLKQFIGGVHHHHPDNPYAEMPSKAQQSLPGILIHYKSDNGRKETLIFTNDSSEGMINVDIGKLRCHGEYDIDLEHPLPPIPANEKQACRMYFKNAPHSSIDLHSFLRNDVEDGQEACVTAAYETRNGKFARIFTLTAHDRGEVIWKPGKIIVQASNIESRVGPNDPRERRLEGWQRVSILNDLASYRGTSILVLAHCEIEPMNYARQFCDILTECGLLVDGPRAVPLTAAFWDIQVSRDNFHMEERPIVQAFATKCTI